jgi:copper homeostasis protein
MASQKLLLEVCANGFESARNAEAEGADLIELCENLEEGGVTPHQELLKLVTENISLPVHVLIRPRPGDFIYSEEEFESMKSAIQFAKHLKAAAIVTGILKTDRTIDSMRSGALVQLAHPLTVTFHRAFDIVKDPLESLETLIRLGFDRILTSGQKENAADGAECIRRLVQHARGRIAILAGGGISEQNIEKVVRESGTNEFHFSAKIKLPDGSLVSDRARIKQLKAKAIKAFSEL